MEETVPDHLYFFFRDRKPAPFCLTKDPRKSSFSNLASCRDTFVNERPALGAHNFIATHLHPHKNIKPKYNHHLVGRTMKLGIDAGVPTEKIVDRANIPTITLLRL